MPDMQIELLALIKEIIGAVVKCKFELYPVLFTAEAQLPAKKPAEVI